MKIENEILIEITEKAKALRELCRKHNLDLSNCGSNVMEMTILDNDADAFYYDCQKKVVSTVGLDVEKSTYFNDVKFVSYVKG